MCFFNSVCENTIIYEIIIMYRIYFAVFLFNVILNPSFIEKIQQNGFVLSRIYSFIIIFTNSIFLEEASSIINK
jgi:hypothetical protein